MNVRRIQEKIDKHNAKWKKERKNIYKSSDFVELFFYIYDKTKIYDRCNGFENLKLYSELLQRLDIRDLCMYWYRLLSGVTFFCCIYIEKNEYYFHYRTNGMEKKTTLRHFIKYNKIVEKQKIEVEIEWAEKFD